MRAAKKKRFQDVTTKPTTEKLTNNWLTPLNQIEKKKNLTRKFYY